jgi:two-component system, OmpR family, sensor histidine kinase KdpD
VTRPLLLRSVPARRVRAGFVTAAAGLTVLTVAIVPVRDRVDLGSTLLVFLLLVVLVAVIGGPWPAVTSAAAAFVLVNYFFTSPLHTLRIDSANNLFTLVVFLVVAGVVSGVVVVLAARSEQVRATADAAAVARIAIEGDRTRAALLAAVSHDLRSPLASAKASVGSLLSTDVHFDAADTTALLNTAEESIDRLITLVEDLLQMSRLQAGALAVAMEEVDVHSAIEDALAFLRVPVGIIDIDVAADATTVWADETLLQRVLANLLANALRFSPPGHYPRVSSRRAEAMVDLTVADTGPGVPATEHARIFQPFQRLGDTDTDSGVGLGLAIARGLSHAMGATLTPTDTPGGGLTMHLLLRIDE